MEKYQITDFFKKNTVWLLLIFIAVTILYAPIKIPVNIAAAGKVYPARKWVLFAGSNGQIMDSYIDMIAGINKSYSTREFSRGDDVRFRVNPNIFEQSIISKNDTIGFISSYETRTLINTAKMQLEVEKAMLQSIQSGEKDEIVDLARKRLEHAKIDAENQIKEFDRKKILYEQEK